MKKIAVPTRDTVVDDHFGHCEKYSIFTIGEDGKIEATETLPSPSGCGCKSNIAAVFQQSGVTVMLAGNMGGGALNVLNGHGITVYIPPAIITAMKTKTKITQKTQLADAPITRNEFKDAFSKMTRDELIGLLCDIYYANAKDSKGAKGGCACDCGCESQSKKTPAKAKVSEKK